MKNIKKETYLLKINDDGTTTKIPVEDFECEITGTSAELIEIDGHEFIDQFNGLATIPIKMSFPHFKGIYKELELINDLQNKLQARGIDPDRLMEVFKNSKMSMSIQQCYEVLIQEQNEVYFGIDNAMNEMKIFYDTAFDANQHVQKKPIQPHYQKFNKWKRT